MKNFTPALIIFQLVEFTFFALFRFAKYPYLLQQASYQIDQKGLMKLSKHTLVSYLIVSTVFVGSGLLFLFNPFGGGIKQAEAAWFNDNWGYRKEVPITANAAADTNAFFSFTLDTATLITAGQLQSSCQDIRVTDVSGNILAYHVGRTNACNNAATTIDALAPYAANGGVPTLPAGASTFYVYYGNPSVGSKDAGAFSQSEAASYTVGTLGTAASAPSPTLYWKFDEAQGTNAEDSTTNGLDGTLSNGPAYQTENLCISAKCLYFAGTDDNVNKTDDAKLDFVAADNFTVSAWVKRNGAASANTVILQKSGANIGTTYTGYKMYMDASGDFCFDIQDGTNAVDTACTSAVEFDDDQWHFVNGVKAATTSVTLYVDGKQRAQDALIASTGTLANASTLRVGVDSDGTSNEWLGFIDEVKVFRDQTARTAAQILADFNARSNPEGVSSQQGNNITNMPNALSNGLVGYWKMEESATPSIDSSGNGSSGTWAGNVAQTTGKYGFGTTYDGTGDYLTMGNVLDFERTNSFSISVWVKSASASPTAAMVILGKLGSNGNLPGYMLSLRGDTAGDPYEFNLRGVTSAEEIQVTFPRTADTNWQHVEVSYSGTSTAAGVKAYVNGVQQTLTIGVDNIASNATNTGSFNIGSRNDGSGPFSGSIDEARVYNRALSGAEVSQLYNWAPGPSGYWKMDEGTGTTAVDASGNGYNGTWAGTPAWSGGKYGKAAKITTRNTDYIQANTTLVTAYPFTMSAWVNTTSGNLQYIFNLGSSSANQANYAIQVTVGGAARASCINSSTGQATGSVVTDGKWHFITGVFTSDTSRDVYVDGVLSGSNTTSCTFNSAVINRFTIGNQSSADGAQSGMRNGSFTDDLKIYNYVRTSAQIIEDMNAGHPAPGSPLSSTVATWKLDEGYGTSAQDWSGNSNTLTLNTATSAWTNSGKFLKAWSGGGARRMSRTTDADLEFSATDSFAVSLWYKTDSGSNPGSTEYFVSDTTANADVGIGIYANTDGTICFGIDDDTTWGPDVSSCTATDFYDGNWHHLTAIRDTALDKIYLYIDSLEKDSDSDTTSATLDGDNTFFVGDIDASDDGEEFTGTIDEIKVYRSALTAEQVKLDMNRSSSEVLGALSASSDSQPNSAASEYCPPDSSTAICTGPVGEWKFDEKTGTTTNDSSGNATAATIGVGANCAAVVPTWTQGKANGALLFSSGCVNAGSATLVDNLPLNNYTAEAWVYKTPSTGGKYVIAKGLGWGFRVNYTSGYVDLLANFGSFQTVRSVNSVVPDNAWTHIAATWAGDGSGTGGTVRFFVNGKETAYATSTTISGTYSSDAGNDLTFGNNHGDGAPFVGKIDQIRLFNYARTPAQIAWDYNKGGPVGWWKMDECQGTTINDMSGFSNTGTLTIGATGTNTAAGTCTTSGAWFDGVSGKKNYSMDLDGTDDYINVENAASTFSNSIWSISAWIKTSQSGVSQKILYRRAAAAGDINFGLQITSGNIPRVLFLTSGSLKTAADPSAISTGTWYHLTGTFDGTTLYFYLNGIQVGSSTPGAASPTGTMTTDIGRDSTDSSNRDYFGGQIDDTRIYNYPLTATQVKALYNDGATRYGPTTGAP